MDSNKWQSGYWLFNNHLSQQLHVSGNTYISGDAHIGGSNAPNGKVGIGTTIPTAKSSMSVAIRISAGMRILVDQN